VYVVWQIHGDGKSPAADAIVLPQERLGWFRTIGFGMQHVVAMFGATFLVPLLTGFPPTTTLLFSGIGTLGFLLITRNKVPSYLGSSFAFIAPIQATMTMHSGFGAALFGILATGGLLAVVGLVVQATSTRWLDALMPPVVTGAIVALIGFNLGGAATDNFSEAPWLATITLASILIIAVVFRGLVARLSILIGVAIGYVAAAYSGQLDFSEVSNAPWFGLPPLHHPVVEWSILPMFLPVVLVLIAENVGHVRSIANLTNQPQINHYTGRTLFADGIATVLAGASGGSATTTYGENIGVMTATRVFSTAAYWVAGVTAILLSFSPKFGELLRTIPLGVLGGVTVALYGLIGLIGIKIWIENRVDFTKPVNQYTAAVSLIIAIGDLTLDLGPATFTGIALGTIAAIVVYHGMNLIEKLRGGPSDPAPQPQGLAFGEEN